MRIINLDKVELKVEVTIDKKSAKNFNVKNYYRILKFRL